MLNPCRTPGPAFSGELEEPATDGYGDYNGDNGGDGDSTDLNGDYGVENPYGL